MGGAQIKIKLILHIQSLQQTISAQKEKNIKNMTQPNTKNIGLRDITVTDSKITSINGQKGQLFYRGYEINDLVNNSCSEEVTYLLIYNKLPSPEELKLTNFK